MKNLDILKQGNKYDRLLATWLEFRGQKVVDLVNNHNCKNRGDFVEMAITGTLVNRTGAHGISHGDTIINGQPVEIKYISRTTSASQQMQGTIARNAIIVFNDGNRIVARLIKESEIVTRQEKGRKAIRFNDNIGLGKEISL